MMKTNQEIGLKQNVKLSVTVQRAKFCVSNSFVSVFV